MSKGWGTHVVLWYFIGDEKQENLSAFEDKKKNRFLYEEEERKAALFFDVVSMLKKNS